VKVQTKFADNRFPVVSLTPFGPPMIVAVNAELGARLTVGLKAAFFAPASSVTIPVMGIPVE